MPSTTRAALAINAGSSSVKCALFTFETSPRPLARETFDGPASSSPPRLMAWIDRHAQAFPLCAIGHRIVHGGPRYRDPQRVTTALIDGLRQLIAFAPNHLPDEIALVEMLSKRQPGVPQVACFDTAFHADLPDVAKRLPIPDRYDAQGIRKYGFHGLSYAFLIEELKKCAGQAAADGRVVLAHLGNGSSLAAVLAGRSIDTTMAFTPIGGVMMSTRSGDLDPGVVTYLARIERLTADQVEDLLSHRAGLLAISGGTGDMRTLLERESTDVDCQAAVAAYVYSVKKAIGALAATLGGLDTLVFSGGIGEHATSVRARICDGLTFLGVEVDEQRNAEHARIISRPSGRVAVHVIPTDEELMIARAAHRLLA
jgi:acetate kinase